MRTLSLVIEMFKEASIREVQPPPRPSFDLKALFRIRDRIKSAAVKIKFETIMNAYRKLQVGLVTCILD